LNEIRKSLKKVGTLPFGCLIKRFCPLSDDSDSFLGDGIRTTSFEALIQMHVSRGNVYQFLRCILRTCFKPSFFGGSSNVNAICDRIKEFVSGNRFDKFALHNCIRGVKVSRIGWLKINRRGQMVKRCTPEESNRRQWIVASIIRLIFDVFVMALVRHNFYLTDTAMNRNRLFFYRMDVWNEISRRAFTSLSKSLFIPLSNDETQEWLSKPSLGYSAVRFLPKEDGVRPIINLKRRLRGNDGLQASPMRTFQPSVNFLLQNAFHILTMESNRFPEIMGTSVISHNQIFQRLKDFRKTLGSTWGSPLYFVKIDIQKAFDTIRQDTLLELVESIIHDNDYIVRRFVNVYSTFGKMLRNFKKKALPASDFCDFSICAEHLTNTMKNAVLIDQVVYHNEDFDSLFQLFKEHICHNIIRHGKSFFRQHMGISQGSILSPLLCNIFYANMEAVLLRDISQKEGTLLIRFLDDFLCISTEKHTIQNFICTMYQGNEHINFN
jgi:telomerase reverse transcriptase